MSELSSSLESIFSTVIGGAMTAATTLHTTLKSTPIGDRIPPLPPLPTTTAFKDTTSHLSHRLSLSTHTIRSEIKGISDTLMGASLLNNPYKAPPQLTSIVSPMVSFPLKFQSASSYADDRVVLVGDAAHSIHPQVSIL